MSWLTKLSLIFELVDDSILGGYLGFFSDDLFIDLFKFNLNSLSMLNESLLEKSFDQILQKIDQAYWLFGCTLFCKETFDEFRISVFAKFVKTNDKIMLM